MKKRPVKKAAAKRTAKKPEVRKATIDLTRGQAYAMLAGISAAIEAGSEPPEELHRDLYEAVQKFRRAFGFKPGDKY